MGFFERLQRTFRSTSASPATVAETPRRGVIVAFDQADAVGTAKLDDGAEVRFGRSACRFEPVIGATIEASGVAPRAGRLQAARLVATDVEALDRALEARDLAAGIASRPRKTPGAVHPLALVTIVFDRALPDRKALRALLTAAGAGAALDFTPAPKLQTLAHTFSLAVTDCPYPQRDGEPLGRSFVTLVANAPLTRASRDDEGRAIDVWALSGLRDLARIAASLARLGEHVVVESANGLELSPESFVAKLGALDDPRARPFAAMLDVTFTSDELAIETHGMRVWGLPDVRVHDPRAARDTRFEARARDAALIACAFMVHDRKALDEGEWLFADDSLAIGPLPLARDPRVAREGAPAFVVVSADVDTIALEPRFD